MNIFNIEPRPLILSGKKVVICWSPKSACSHIAVWFFLKEGLLRAANYYSDWPHDFRARVYYQTVTYLAEAQALIGSGGAGYTLVKITRDPAKRMVSIFRHAARHTFLREALDQKLRRDTAATGLSLVDLRKFMTGQNLTVPSEANFHLCAQHHPAWDMAFDRTITLNMDETDLNGGLNMIEAELELGVTNFPAFPKFENLRQQHYAQDAAYTGEGPVEEHRFTPAQTGSFPKKALEQAAFLTDMARDLHAVDYAGVGSGDTAGRLVFPAKTRG
jgi:hypothetical protein